MTDLSEARENSMMSSDIWSTTRYGPASPPLPRIILIGRAKSISNSESVGRAFLLVGRNILVCGRDSPVHLYIFISLPGGRDSPVPITLVGFLKMAYLYLPMMPP